ncbi:hypothetical protein LP420_22810 [Massilia sp. B-10]|nr:hypothetical protein LP420_22810 [Massilia sp. B-10]
MLAGYVAGYNRYLADSAYRLPAACANAAWVRPITIDDMYRVLAEKALHASGEVFSARNRQRGAHAASRHAWQSCPSSRASATWASCSGAWRA